MEYIQSQSYKKFKRFCKVLDLNSDPALIKEYKAAHREGAVWPEITQGMRDVGILDMEIYLDGTRLIMIMDTEHDFDHDKQMDLLSEKPRQAEWEKAMSRFQISDADASADAKWRAVERIFKLDK